MRELRLSIFNIKKHKAESVSIIILMTICMTLMSAALIGYESINGIFGKVMEELHGIRNHIVVPEKDYYEQYDEVLANDPDVLRFTKIESINSFSTSFIDENGEEASQYMCFVNEENERKIEDFMPESAMLTENLSEIAHPIYAPYYVKDTLNKSEGDTFTVIYNGKEYSFTVVGFYESCIYSDNLMYLKFVVSDEDFQLLEKVMGKSYILGFDEKEGTSYDVVKRFKDYVDENTNNGEVLAMQNFEYDDLKIQSGSYIKVTLVIILLMSVVVLLSVLIMIGHQISNDISNQIVSIGVLEALGYKSGEISLSYVYEYLILGIVGILFGATGSIAITPSLHHMGELMSGHHAGMQFIPLLPVYVGILLEVFVVLISYAKSRMVKKYPPVMAFRKGISDHNFSSNLLPLEKTRSNIHLRLALKGAIVNTRQNIGAAICILAVTLAVICCYVMYCYCDDGMNTIRSLTGMEMTDLRIGISKDTDANLMAEELLSMAEVERVNKTNEWLNMSIRMNGFKSIPVVYEDYSNTTQLIPRYGRLPKHDNEVMLAQLMAKSEGIEVGDIVTLKLGKIEKEYIVCGTISAVTNAGSNIYLTESGIKRIKPSYRSDVIEIYLKDGVDRKEFEKWITHTYGRSMADALEDDCSADTKEERIRAEAEKKMAILMSEYGIGHVEYSIIVDGKQITGNSAIFKVTSVISLIDILYTQLAGAIAALSAGTRIVMLIAVIVIMIIMFMIMESGVKKQWRELGIMKGLGFTSRELMLQLSFKIVPVLIIGIVLGTGLALYFVHMLSTLLGDVAVNCLGVVVADLLLFVFAYIAAYLGARKIKNISVYELMTE